MPGHPAERDDRPQSAALSRVRARDPLLDHAATEIGVEESTLGPADGLAKIGAGDPFPPARQAKVKI
jgi:hypothetical protein